MQTLTELKDRMRYLEQENERLKAENKGLIAKIVNLEKYSAMVINEISRIENSTKRVSDEFKQELEKSILAAKPSLIIEEKRLFEFTKRNSISSLASGHTEENDIGNNAVFLEGIMQGFRNESAGEMRLPARTSVVSAADNISSSYNHKKCIKRIHDLSDEVSRYKAKIKEYDTFMKEVLGDLVKIEVGSQGQSSLSATKINC